MAINSYFRTPALSVCIVDDVPAPNENEDGVEIQHRVRAVRPVLDIGEGRERLKKADCLNRQPRTDGVRELGSCLGAADGE